MLTCMHTHTEAHSHRDTHAHAHTYTAKGEFPLLQVGAICNTSPSGAQTAGQLRQRQGRKERAGPPAAQSWPSREQGMQLPKEGCVWGRMQEKPCRVRVPLLPPSVGSHPPEQGQEGRRGSGAVRSVLGRQPVRQPSPYGFWAGPCPNEQSCVPDDSAPNRQA